MLGVITVALVVTALAIVLATVVNRLPGTVSLDRALRRIPNWALVLAGCFVLFVGATLLFQTPWMGVFFLALIATVSFVRAWFRDFAYLMTQPDEAFPGRYDKLIWALLLVVLPPVGVLAFWSYRRAQQGEEAVAAKPRAADWF